MVDNVVALLRSGDGRRLVRAKCQKLGLSMAVLEDLIMLELRQSGKMRKRGLWQDFDELFGLYIHEEDL